MFGFLLFLRKFLAIYILFGEQYTICVTQQYSSGSRFQFIGFIKKNTKEKM